MSRRRIQVEINEHSEKTLDNLKVVMGISSEAQIMRIAIQLLDEIVESQKRGESLLIHKSDGSVEKLKLIY